MGTELGTRLETRLEVTKLQQRLTPLVEEEQTLIPMLLRVRFFSISVMLLCYSIQEPIEVLCRLPSVLCLMLPPSTLDTSYAVELADGRISETNIVLRGCTLGLLEHPFDIDLMSVELGSFDVIIGMDWLAKYHALIVCDKKVVRILYGDEVLIIRGDNCDVGSNLNIISCTRTQKYIQKGCQVYLAQVTSKKAKDKSDEKQLEDVPIIREFSEVFLEDLLGLPPP
ncbi:putative reverse transcriptase domain-containing protein [Tanacetum coccineum]